MVEVMHMTEPTDVQEILKRFHNPKEREDPEKEVRGAGHLPCALRHQDLRHRRALGNPLEVDTHGKEGAEAHDEPQSAVSIMSMWYCYHDCCALDAYSRLRALLSMMHHIPLPRK